MSEEKATYHPLTIPMLEKQSKSKVKFLMWEKKFKGLAVAKGFSLVLTGMKDIPNKYDNSDDTNITTDEEK